MRITKRSTRIVFQMAAVVFVAALWGCGSQTTGQARVSPSNRTSEQVKRSENVPDKITKSDDEWRGLLTPEQYRVTRQCGTEPPFTGKYYNFKGEGTYLCVACGNELFPSDTKFDSGTGWPSFYAPVTQENIEEKADKNHGMVRVEVRCSRCGAHLGHVFEDGPGPTGLRYCINSAALNFVDKANEGEQDKKGETSGNSETDTSGK